MLITNTPNSELHVYNNSGEEIVKIDGSGVVKPDSGLPAFVMNNPVFGYADNELYYILADGLTEEEAHAYCEDFKKYKKIVINNADLKSLDSPDIERLNCELIDSLGMGAMWEALAVVYSPTIIHVQVMPLPDDDIWYVVMFLEIRHLSED